jgi:hypothetical protein
MRTLRGKLTLTKEQYKPPQCGAPEVKGLEALEAMGETKFMFEGAELEFKAAGSLEKFTPYANAATVRTANNLTGSQFPGMHLFPRAAGRGLANPRTALVRIGELRIHLSVDKGWLADTKALAATGQRQMPAWDLYQSVSASIQRSALITPMEKFSLVGRDVGTKSLIK